MGKQINYWMEYDSFLLLAETALKQDCIIIRESNGKVLQSKDLSIVTSDCYRYYFYLLAAGTVKYKTLANGREVVDCGYTQSGSAIIEAGFSCIAEKKMTRSRLFTISGYYNEIGEWINRPNNVTKVYTALVRQVKKIAPYCELKDKLTYKSNERYGEEYEWVHKEYISPYCLKLREKGYSMRG